MIELSKLKILTLDYYIWGQVKYAQRGIFAKMITLHKKKIKIREKIIIKTD